jgi:hypothetical protein
MKDVHIVKKALAKSNFETVQALMLLAAFTPSRFIKNKNVPQWIIIRHKEQIPKWPFLPAVHL